MKKATLLLSCDSEKLAAVKLYLGQKELTVEDELCKALEVLYGKHVPTNVREFLELRDREPKQAAGRKKNTSVVPLLDGAEGRGAE